jgi:hypothetical protein
MVLTLEIGVGEHYPTFVTIRTSAVTIGQRATLDAVWMRSVSLMQTQERDGDRAYRRRQPPRGREIGAVMGLMDDAKDTAEATGKKVGEWADDTKERVSDKVDEMKADADVKAAEAHRDAVDSKNEYKEDLRKS